MKWPLSIFSRKGSNAKNHTHSRRSAGAADSFARGYEAVKGPFDEMRREAVIETRGEDKQLPAGKRLKLTNLQRDMLRNSPMRISQDQQLRVNIVGPEDGAVRDLPTYAFESMDVIQKKIPLEVIVSEHREFELSQLGFCALAMLKGADSAAFLSASSCQRPMEERGGGISEQVLSWNLSRQLPYMFLITRLAHYIKVIQRENIGTWKSAMELEREINAWLAQYVTVMNDPDKETRGRRPFNYARVEVSGDDTSAGWYTVRLRVRPHFRYMGMHFTLALTGKLDR